MDIKTHITSDPLSLDHAFEFINDERYGGNCLFVGTVRKVTEQQVTEALEFESFDAMALKEMEKIGKQVLAKHGPGKCYIAHRKGHVGPSTIVVIIGISTPYRKTAFKACEQAIDTLKETVPIWKKEILEDGSFWVNAHP